MADKRIVTVDYLNSEGLNKDYINNTFANALKGNKSDNAILIDDVSPVTHDMGVKVRGKNLFDINGFINLKDNSTYYGINDNGELYVKQSDFRDDTVIPAFVTLEAGTYTLSSTTAITSNFKLINLTDNKTIAFNNNVTFSIEKATSLGIKCWQSANTVIGKFQLELGTTATDYTPYVPDLTAVKVSRCGKNLFDNNKLSEWGLTLSDGKYTGSVSVLNSKTLFSSFKSNTRYTISVKASNASKSSATLLISINYTDGTTQTVIRVNSTTEKVYSFTSTANKSISNITSTYYDVDTINIAYIQIEEGTIATEYEPYKGADYTPTADGTVEGVTSLYPNTTLMTDTEGVLIDCEYNRDINKAFAELQQAIISLGGNV